MNSSSSSSITTIPINPTQVTVRQYHFDNPTIQYFNDASDIKKSFLLVLEEAFANKTITWFGDSIMRQKYMSLVGMLSLHKIPHTHNITAYEMKISKETNSSDLPYQRIVDCGAGSSMDVCTTHHPDYVPHAEDHDWMEHHPLRQRTRHSHHHHHQEHTNLRDNKDVPTRYHHSRRRKLVNLAVTHTSVNTTTSPSQFQKYNCHCSTIWTLYVPSYNFLLYHVNLFKFHVPRDYLPNADPLFFVVGANVVHYQTLLDLLPISDHMMVNVGLHEEKTPLEEYTSLIRFFIDSLSEDMKKRPVTRRWAEEHGVSEGTEIDLKNVPAREHRRHAFYLSEPVHFQGLHGYSDYFMRDIHHMNNVVPAGKDVVNVASSETSCSLEAREAATAAVTEGLLKDRLNYIDATDLLATEGNYHMDHYPRTKGDCVHWCFIYEHFQARWSMIASLFSGRFDEKSIEV
jgi:hypothetical protein